VIARPPGAVLVVLLLTACAVPSPTESPSAHQTASAAPTSTVIPTESPGIVNLHMITSLVGWSQRQSDGAILHTTRGVLRWTVATPAVGAEQILTVAFIDANAVRALSALVPDSVTPNTPTTITSWASSDGGTTWTRGGTMTVTGVGLPYAPPGSLDFVDRQHGWYSITGLGAAGSSAIFIYRTSDGGTRWSEVDQTYVSPTPGPGKLPSGCDKNPASFIDASTGWVTASCNGGAAFLYVTHDGGLSWKQQTLRFLNSVYGNQTYPPEFASNKVGFMLGDAGTPGSNALLFDTIDGGTTWSMHATPGPAPQTLDFLDAVNGWLAGSPSSALAPESALWVTHNAGRTWMNTNPNANLNGFGLDFLTTQLGWASSPSPLPSSSPAQLLETTDGGHTWVGLNPTIGAT
jgi:photosystem II stability/assembly factor-like uncharacterized protein